MISVMQDVAVSKISPQPGDIYSTLIHGFILAILSTQTSGKLSHLVHYGHRFCRE